MALGSLKRRARSPIMSEINITPLTDIFLVLLIIFMVTSAAMVESGRQDQLARSGQHHRRSRARSPSR